MRFNSKFKIQYDRPRKEFYPKATGLEVIVRNNDVEKAIRILKKKVAKSGLMRELKQRQYYEKPSDKRIRKNKEAVKRWRKVQKKLQERW